MKRIGIPILILLLSMFCSLKTMAATDTYTFDPQHSYLLWHINHFGFSEPSGKWFFNGSLILDDANPDKSKVNATIKVGDVVTGLPELDKHLKGALFFDVDKFPLATFVSDKVQVTGKNTADVTGQLTVHGVTKPITLKMTLNKMGVNPISNKTSVGFSGSTQLKRSDFGINTLLTGLSDEVDLEIQAEAYK